MQSGFTVTLEGQYFYSVGEGKGKALKKYSFDINLPTMVAALSIIKNKLLDKILSKKYEDYVTYRTHVITNVKPFGEVGYAKVEIWQMSRPDLIAYAREQELPVKFDIYPALMELRNAIEMAESDPDRFDRLQKDAEEEFEFMSTLRELNPELYKDAPDTIDENVLAEL